MDVPEVRVCVEGERLKRGGKPKLPAHIKRSEWINFRATVAEVDAVHVAAIRAGEKLGNFIMKRLGFRATDTSNPFPGDEMRATLHRR